MTLETKKAFFDHIALLIEKLTDDYQVAFDELESGLDNKMSADTENFTLRRLNRAINAFKEEMRSCLIDFYQMMDKGIISEQYIVIHLRVQIDALHKVRNKLDKLLTESELKEGLKENYHFHKNLEKLTPESIYHYFEVNYTLRKK